MQADLDQSKRRIEEIIAAQAQTNEQQKQHSRLAVLAEIERMAKERGEKLLQWRLAA